MMIIKWRDIDIVILFLFVVSMFLTSDSNQFRVMGMTAPNLVTIFMLGYWLLKGYIRKHIFLIRHPLSTFFILAILWAILSLVANEIIPSKAVPVEAYYYSWAVGINNPEWRGLAFIFRLVLGILVVEFLCIYLQSKEQFLRLIKFYMPVYFIFCTIPVVQFVLYLIFDISVGQIFPSNSSMLPIRVGAYVGEPSVLSCLLISGYFIALGFLKYPQCSFTNKYKWFVRSILIFATIDIFITFSSSIIIGMIFTSFIMLGKFIRKHRAKTCLGATIVIIAFSTILKPTITKLLEEISTIGVRSLSWIVGTEMFTHNLISGLGLGRSPFFNSVYLPSNLELTFEIGDWFNYTALRHPPMNTYLEWGAEMGLIGLLILLFGAFKIYSCIAQQNKLKSWYKFVNLSFGAGLLTICIAANAFPGAFYLAHFQFLLGMYIAGLRLNDDDHIAEDYK